MKKITHVLAFVALAAGTGFVVYRYVLSDEEKATIATMVESAKDAYGEVSARIQSLTQYEKTSGDTNNRDATMRQWARLGF